MLTVQGRLWSLADDTQGVRDGAHHVHSTTGGCALLQEVPAAHLSSVPRAPRCWSPRSHHCFSGTLSPRAWRGQCSHLCSSSAVGPQPSSSCAQTQFLHFHWQTATSREHGVSYKATSTFPGTKRTLTTPQLSLFLASKGHSMAFSATPQTNCELSRVSWRLMSRLPRNTKARGDLLSPMTMAECHSYLCRPAVHGAAPHVSVCAHVHVCMHTKAQASPSPFSTAAHTLLLSFCPIEAKKVRPIIRKKFTCTRIIGQHHTTSKSGKTRKASPLRTLSPEMITVW